LKELKMNTLELQKEIIARIATITDNELLDSIKKLLEFRTKEPFLNLTSEDEEELLLASNQAQEGQFIYQNEMDKKVQEWLGGN
jgi:hypothetical protein